MNKHSSQSPLGTWITGVILVAFLMTMFAIAAHSDNRMRAAEALEANAAAAIAKAQERRQRAARAICHEHHASAIPRWEEDGALTCVVIAQGVQR